MSSTKTDPTIILDIGRIDRVWAVAFHPDGKHLLGGYTTGIQRWQLEDGQEAGKQTGMDLNAISASRNHKWIVCGSYRGASVWDAEIQEKVTEVEGEKRVYAVDASPDSTSFATGTDEEANIWNITNGKRVVGPLRHGNPIRGLKFSPSGEQIATSCSRGSIRIFDSHNGDELVTIRTITTSGYPRTPLAWSNDGKQIFAVCEDERIKSFDVFTRSQLAKSHILKNVESIALAANGTFIATCASNSVSFLDTTTLSHIGPVIEDDDDIRSIALSLDSRYLAIGRRDGKVTVRNLGGILPDMYYGPLHASTEQPSTSDGHENKPLDSTLEGPGKSSSVKSETHSNDGDGDLLEVEAPSNVPASQFDYEDSLSPVSSVNSPEDGVPPLGPSHAVPQSSDTPPVTSPTEAHLEAHHNKAVESSQGLRSFKRWLQTNIRRSRKDPGSHEPDGRSGKSRRPAAAVQRSPSQSAGRVDVTNEGVSHMAATRRVPRAVAKPVVKRQPKSPAKAAGPKHRNKKASHSGKRPTGATAAGAAQQVNDTPPPTTGTVRVTRESDKAILSIALPGWMCFGSSTGDGTH